MNDLANVLPLNLPEPPATPRPAGRPAPTIVHESEYGTVYHGRSEDLLRVIPTESVDLIITDPPYGVSFESRRRKESFGTIDGDGDSLSDRETITGILEHCVRIVRQQRHIYCFGPADVLAGLKVSDVVNLVWDKGTMGGGDVTSSWGPSHEPISFTVSKHRHAGKAGLPTLPTRLRKGSVLSFNRPTGRNVRHPNEKPVGLIRELMESSSRQGETILDPFAGSLSTAVAAILSGRRYIVCESDTKWIPLGLERIKAAESAMQLAQLAI